MSEYDCVGVTSEYLDSLKNKIIELEHQVRDSAEALTLCWSEKRELEQQKAELMKIIEDDYQYFALKNNPETGRAKFLKTVINKYK